MILTEAEAANKWCPFAAMYAFNAPMAMDSPAETAVGPTVTGGPANRYTDSSGTYKNPPNCRCLGSGCMAWTWMLPADAGVTARQGCCGLAMGARMGHA